MGKTVGVGNASQRQVNMQGALGKHLGRYLDQYTMLCVFGSVVGYAVMPLIGTVETLVLSMIVLGLSIHGLRKNQHKEDDRRRYRGEDRKSKRQQDSRKPLTVQVITDSETQHRRMRDEGSKVSKNEKTSAEDEEAERLRRLEEKREKKAKKKEERNKRKEEERKEKEREEMARKERQEQRAMKRQQEKEAKERARGFLIPTYETIKAMVGHRQQKPVRRERKHSTSSTSSGSSSTPTRSLTHTPPRPHPLPVRASSDPVLYPSSNSLPWSNTSVVRKDTRPPICVPSAVVDSSTVPAWSGCSTDNVVTGWPNHSPETLTAAQQIWYSNEKLSSHQNSALLTSSVWQHSPSFEHDNQQQNGRLGPRVSPNGRFYSLFSNEHSSPFMNLQSSSEDNVVCAGNQLLDTSKSDQKSESGFDEWPNI